MNIPPMQHFLDENSREELSDIVYHHEADGASLDMMPSPAGMSMPGSSLRPGRRTILGGLLGTSFAAFALGFDACLFDLDRVDECVAHAHSWIDRFGAMGMHLIEWFIAIMRAAFAL